MIAVLLGFVVSSSAQLPDSVLTQFGGSSAQVVLKNDPSKPTTSMVAAQMLADVVSGAHGFVAEDGSAVGVRNGTFSAISVPTGRLITRDDRFSAMIGGAEEPPVSFNQSQVRYLKLPKSGVYCNLDVRAMVDDRSVFLVSGVPSLMERQPRDGLVLSRLDFQRRGADANQSVLIRMPLEFGANDFVLGAGPVLRLETTEKLVYLRVNMETLAATKLTSPPDNNRRDWRHFSGRGKKLQLFNSAIFWNGDLYGLGSASDNGKQRAYHWDGKRISFTDPWMVAAASINEKFAWLVNQDTGDSWVIRHR